MPLFSKKKPSERARRNRYSTQSISRKVSDLSRTATRIQTRNEETTKVQLIFPFLSAFGWDIGSPEIGGLEVRVVGGNRADVMLSERKAIKVVLEAKPIGTTLSEHVVQLRGYFENCHASIGILTDGVLYDFYSYEDDTERMSAIPFASVTIDRLCLGGRNNWLLYFRRNDLNIEKLIMLSRTRMAFEQAKKEDVDVKNSREMHRVFQKFFPSSAPQELDELIEFARWQYR